MVAGAFQSTSRKGNRLVTVKRRSGSWSDRLEIKSLSILALDLEFRLATSNHRHLVT
jgi:hypothetical protein